MRRRTVLYGLGTAAVATLSGCLGDDDDADDEETPTPDPDDPTPTPTPDADDPTPDPSESVTFELLGFRDIEGEYAARFTLENHLDEAKTYSIQLDALDGDGEEIDGSGWEVDAPAGWTVLDGVGRVFDADEADEVDAFRVYVLTEDRQELFEELTVGAELLDQRQPDVTELNGVSITDHALDGSAVVGTVENGAGVDVSSVAVRVEAYDAGGEFVGDRYVSSVDELADGETWDFDVHLSSTAADGLDDYRIDVVDEGPLD